MRKGVFVARALLAFSLFSGQCAWGQAYPPAPQSASSQDGVDAAGWVRVPDTAHGGIGGFVDVPAYAGCRYVTVTSNTGGESIPVGSAASYNSWRASSWTGHTMQVCCRPQTVTLCKGAAGGTVSETLPYTIYGQSQTPVATCLDQWGETYTDSETWVCGQTGSGSGADGSWAQSGSDSYGCTSNAFTTGCSASCPTTTGTTTTYDSCGNVQSVNACSISCCTNNWQESVGACGAGNTQTVTWTNYGTCGGSFSYQQGCICSPTYSCGACDQGTGQKTCTDTTCGTGSTQQACTWTQVGGSSCSPYACSAQSPTVCGGETCGPNPPNWADPPYDCGLNSTWSYWGTQSNCVETTNIGGCATGYACYGYQ